MSEEERKQICIYLTHGAIPILRDASLRLGVKDGSKGSVSAIVQYIADRIQQGEDPFGGRTFEEFVFNSLLELAESLQRDLHLGEDETVEILRKAANRSFDGLQSQALDNIILDIRAILFGETTNETNSHQ